MARPTSTQAVRDRLYRDHPDRYMWEVWELLDYSSLEAFTESATRWLLNRSELRSRTVHQADYRALYEEFRTLKERE